MTSSKKIQQRSAKNMLLSVARHFSKVRYEVFADLSMETGCLSQYQ